MQECEYTIKGDDPITAALQFLKQHGCFVALQIHVESVREELQYQMRDEPESSRPSPLDSEVMDAIEEATKEHWDDGNPSPIVQVSDGIQMAAAHKLMPNMD